ncbi:MAG: tol-pal system-associated acyl-CoA thioesterase [Gammaproteobacteria bacterium]
MDSRAERVNKGIRSHARNHKSANSKPRAASHAVFVWPVRVYYEDTDLGGVVYHANYLRFMERARTEWLRRMGFEQDTLRERLGVQFVVVGMQLDFHRPARFNDRLEVQVAIMGMKRASLVFGQSIHAVSAGNALVCSAEVRVACVDSVTIKPQPLPREIVAELH